MKAYVFLGPSLSLNQARNVLDASYLPPAQQGDVIRILSNKPTAIGIIDGYFESVPAVWHKEILLALSEGVHVFGASSMGALRAAELHTFGMIGVGQVFEQFRSGTLTDDDEVAVVHGPEELRYPLSSVAMVDVRDACQHAVTAGLLTDAAAELLISQAKAIHFRDRTYSTISDALTRMGMDPTEVRSWMRVLQGQGQGLKERDAINMLEVMRDFLTNSPIPVKPSFALEQTEFLEKLRNEVRLLSVTRSECPPMHVLETLRGVENLHRLRRNSLLRVLARSEGRRLGWELSVADVDQKAQELLVRWQFQSHRQLLDWMHAEKLSESSFWQFVNDECLIDRLEYLHSHMVEESLPDELRIATAALNIHCNAPSC